MPPTPLTESDLVPFEGEEPRVHDLLLAERLGFGQARDVRKLIKSRKKELEGYGVLRHRAAKSNDPRGRGRPALEYYLNEEQALILCMVSEAPRAIEVRREIVIVYQAWRKGRLGGGFSGLEAMFAAFMQGPGIPLLMKMAEQMMLQDRGASIARDHKLTIDWLEQLGGVTGTNRRYLSRRASTRMARFAKRMGLKPPTEGNETGRPMFHVDVATLWFQTDEWKEMLAKHKRDIAAKNGQPDMFTVVPGGKAKP